MAFWVRMENSDVYGTSTTYIPRFGQTVVDFADALGGANDTSGGALGTFGNVIRVAIDQYAVGTGSSPTYTSHSVFRTSLADASGLSVL